MNNLFTPQRSSRKDLRLDGDRNIQPDSAGSRGCHCYWIMSHDSIDDSQRPGACADRVRLRYYPPGTLQRRSSDRDRKQRSTAETEASRMWTRPCVCLIAPGLCPTIRKLRPHRHLPMGTHPSLALMSIRSPNRLSEVGRAPWLVPACHSAGCGVWILTLSVQTAALARHPWYL